MHKNTYVLCRSQYYFHFSSCVYQSNIVLSCCYCCCYCCCYFPFLCLIPRESDMSVGYKLTNLSQGHNFGTTRLYRVIKHKSLVIEHRVGTPGSEHHGQTSISDPGRNPIFTCIFSLGMQN